MLSQRGQAGPGRYPEFLEGLPEVGFDGGLRDEQVLGDLPVGQAVRGQSGHPPFGAGERVRTGERGAPRPGAGGQQLVPGPLGQGRRARALREILGAEQRGPRVPGMACPAQMRTQVAQGLGQVVPGLRGFQQADRFSQVCTGLIKNSRGADPQRDADGPRVPTRRASASCSRARAAAAAGSPHAVCTAAASVRQDAIAGLVAPRACQPSGRGEIA